MSFNLIETMEVSQGHGTRGTKCASEISDTFEKVTSCRRSLFAQKIGDEILPSYIGILKSQYTDIHEAISIMECPNRPHEKKSGLRGSRKNRCL